MRTLEAIDEDLALAREALSSVEGTPAEVYSRIVGYYRSVRNWNRGKREEYGERKLYRVKDGEVPASSSSPAISTEEKLEDARLLLFVRASCPGCPPAKDAAGKLGIPVDYINADTQDGLAEAQRLNVMSTPTAILFNREGCEIQRAWDSRGITAFAAAV